MVAPASVGYAMSRAPMVPFRHDVFELFDLEVRWVRVPCVYGPEICDVREHMAGLANVIGTDSWCRASSTSSQRRTLGESFPS